MPPPTTTTHTHSSLSPTNPLHGRSYGVVLWELATLQKPWDSGDCRQEQVQVCVRARARVRGK